MALLITVEGGEYVGKTSLAVPALKTVLTAAGLEILTSREPGGTVKSEELRKQIFDRINAGAPTEEIAKLLYTARKIHLDEVIIPFLGENKEQNRIMILDRYLDSSRIYQGLEGGLSMNEIQKLDEQYVQGFLPDLTYIMYLPEKMFDEVFMLRKNYVLHNFSLKSNRDLTAWDQIDLAKHKRRQKFYMQLPQLAIDRNEDRVFEFIDAAKHPYEVIRELIIHCASFIIRSNKVQTSYKSVDDYLKIFEKLKDDGVWKDLDHIWQEQHNPSTD